MGAGLDVDDDDVATGLDVAGEQLVGVDHHQMGFEGNRHVGPTSRDDVRPEGQIGNENAVHHVELDSIDAGQLEVGTLLTEAGEIGRQNRRGDGDRSGHEKAG